MAELTREELTRRGLEAFKNSKGTAFESQTQAKPWINTEQDKRLDEVSKGTEHAVPYWAKNLKDPLTTSYYEKVDTLKAEYPVFAKNIDAVRAKGYSDAQIRAYLSRQEFINRAYYSHDTIEKMYGRTAESWNDYWEGMNAQKDAAYVKILKHKMPEERIRDIVKTARINSMSPALLFRSPALLKKAEEMAGERLGTLEHLIASIGNAISNTNSISAGSEKFIAESSQQEIKRLEKILSEGSELEPENGALVPIGARAIENEDERREFVRNNIQQRIETLKKQVQTWSDWQKTDEADTQRWYTNIRPTDSAIGAFLYSAIENSGTTILSAIRSGIGWGLGGVAGGMLASAFNTWDESTGEAGRVLIEGLKRGMSDTEAYNAARQDYYGNLAYLGISNFGGDVFRFGLGHVRGLLAQHGKNAIVSRLDKWLGYASGLPDKLAGKITGDKIFHKVLRGAVKYGLPEVLEAIPEGGEEVFQDWYSAYVLGDKVKAEELWSSFWGGVGQSLVYSLAGKGTGKVIDKITGADARKKAQEDVARVIQEVQKTVQEGNKLEAGLNDGTIKADDIVAEDPVVFLPRASLTEQVREQLGLNDETTEVLSDKDELTTSEAAQIDAESTGEVQEVQAGNNQAENQQDDEVAVRQSVWDEFKKEHPEEAAALEPNLRTGVKGVTAAERLAQIEEFLNLDMPTVEAQQVRNIVSQVQNDWKNLRGEVGFNISDEVIEAESTIYGHYLLSCYAEYGFTSPGEFHEFKLQNGDNPVENVLNQLMHHNSEANLAADEERNTRRGYIDVSDPKKVVLGLTKNADASTFLHEIWHMALADLLRYGNRAAASEQVKADRKTAMEWLGITKADFDNPERMRTAQEDWARAGEAYFMTGKAPTKQLQGVFQRIRAWMLEIYDGIKASLKLNRELTDEIREVFDRMLALEEDITEANAAESNITVGQSRHEAEQISARVRELEAEIRANGDNIPEETAAAEAADYQAVFFQDVEELKTQAEAVRSRYEGTEEWLKAPNGEQSNLDERTWCLVRTPNFKRWFGHWNYDAKTKIEVTDINNKGLTVDFKDTKSLKKWLENAYAGKTVEIEDDGVIVGFSKKKLNDSLKRRGEVQREAYAVLEELIKKSHYYDFEENDGQDKHKNLIGQDIYYSALKVGNDYYSVKFKFDVLRENLSSTYKDHRITEIKISPLVYHTQTQANSSATHARTGDKLFYTLSDLAGGVKPQQASKVVDENGEPLVVYHGTDYGGFSVFNTSQEGIFFSNYDRASWYTHDYDPKIIRRPPDFKSWEDVKDYAREHDIDFEEADKNEYGDGKFFINGEITWDLNEASDILFKAKSENGNIGNIYACFLNIKKPNVIHAKGKSAYDIEQIRKNAKQDGVIVYDIVDGTYDEGSQFEATNYIVFNPEQIKAIDNVGTFNPGNSDIYYQDALEVNGENESTPEWLDVEAARDVEGWLKEWGAYEVRRDEYQNLREGIRLIKELGGLRFQDFVNVLGRELAVDLRSQWSGLFRNIQGKIKLPLDQLMQSLEAEGLRFEYADDFINWLENAAKQQPKRPLPLVEINEKTLDALIHSIGFDGAKDYIDQRRRYLKALQRKIQAEYDKDKSNAQVRADLETTYKEQREISEQLKRFDWAFAESEADIPEWLADTSWLDGDNKNRTEVKKRRTQPENLTLSEAFKKGYGLAEKYSREAYKAGFKAGREQQHTKDAERIANLKDTQKERIAALKAKYKQLQALEKAKKALNAFIDKMVNDVKEAINDKKVIWHVQQEIKKELEKIDLKHRSKQALERQHDVEFLLESIGKTPETLTQEDMDTLGITAKDLKNLGKSSIDEMTIAELYKLHEKIQELREQGRRELEVKNLLNKERINKMREELWRPLLEKLAKRPRGAVKSRKDLDKIYAKGIKGAAQRALDYINTRTLGANRFFDRLDGGKGAYNGAWVRYFVDAINDAQNEKLRHIFERREWIEARMQELGLKAADLAQERKVDIPDISSEPWTVDRLMSIYAGMKNEKSRAAILYGNFAQAKSFVDLTQAKTEEEQQELIYDKANEWAAKCVQALTNKEKAFADAIIEEYEMHFERINNALIDVYNRGMSHEENYTPMRRLEVNAYGNISTPDTAQTMLDNSYTVQAGGGSKSGDLGHVDRGFAKERIKNLPAKAQASIDLGLFNIWNTQMEAQEHAAAFVRPVQDMRKILTGRNKNKQEMTIQKAVKLVHGKDAWAFIRNYFNIAAQDQTLLAHDVLDGVFGWLAKNASRAYLCANAGTALKQTTSFPRFLPYCGLTHMLKAIGEFAADHKKFINECYALDPQLKARSGNVILQSMRASAELGKYGEILDMGMKPIQWMDKGASIIGWKAVYDANIAKGKSQQEAVRAAQRAVALTQQTIHVKDAPLLWQQGGLVRLAMIFSSDTAQTFGISIYDLAASIRAGNAPKFLSTILSVTLAATMMGLLTKGGPDDDDWDSLSGWLEFMGSSLARQTVETIPLLGKGLLNLWDSKGYSTGEQSAYLAPFARIISAGSKLWDTKSDNNEDAFFNLMEAGALFAPFPVTAVRRLWRVGGDVARGEFWDGFKHSIGLRREFKKARRRLSR